MGALCSKHTGMLGDVAPLVTVFWLSSLFVCPAVGAQTLPRGDSLVVIPPGSRRSFTRHCEPRKLSETDAVLDSNVSDRGFQERGVFLMSRNWLLRYRSHRSSADALSPKWTSRFWGCREGVSKETPLADFVALLFHCSGPIGQVSEDDASRRRYAHSSHSNVPSTRRASISVRI